MFRRDGVVPKEAKGGGAAQAAWVRVGPDGEVLGALDDEVEGDACGRLMEEEESEVHVGGLL